VLGGSPGESSGLKEHRSGRPVAMSDQFQDGALRLRPRTERGVPLVCQSALLSNCSRGYQLAYWSLRRCSVPMVGFSEAETLVGSTRPRE
jgi:hypothetical protein